MSGEEFKTATFATAEQWRYGVGDRIRFEPEGGIGLFSYPSQLSWLTRTAATAVTMDECGALLWVDGSGTLWQLLPEDEQSQALGEFEIAPVQGTGIVGDLIWIHSNRSLHGFAVDNLQLVMELEFANAIRVAFDTTSIVVADRQGVYAYDKNGQPSWEHLHDRPLTPCAVASTQTSLYLIALEAERIIRIPRSDAPIEEIGDRAMAQPKATLAVATPEGSIATATRGDSTLYLLDPFGELLGEYDLQAEIYYLALSDDNLVVATASGIVQLANTAAPVDIPARFLSFSLDNGADSRELWHRVDFLATIPPGTHVDVQYAFADSTDDGIRLRRRIDGLLTDDSLSPRTRINRAFNGLEGRWSTPETLRPIQPAQGNTESSERRTASSVLLSESTQPDKFGRYVWVLLSLTSHQAASRPSVKTMKVIYPRQSYLRYLPAVYQSDPNSDLLAGFLSTFETSLGSLGATISVLHKFVDPRTTPVEFLPWLSSWLNVVLDEDWTASVKQALLENAFLLFERKGTAGGTEQLLSIVLGTQATLVEHALAGEPAVLASSSGTTDIAPPVLGQSLVLLQGPPVQARFGEQMTLGGMALGARAQPDAARREQLGRYSILINLESHELEQSADNVARLLRAYAPAHTEYRLIATGGGGIGVGSTVGIGLQVGDFKPLALGGQATLGDTIVVTPGETSRLERNSRITDSGFRLM